MVEPVESCFLESELDDLRCLIRLTVEFHDYLQSGPSNPLEPNYTCESVFAAVESFMSLTRAYKVLVGAIDSTLGWDMISMPSLKKQFLSMFDEFNREVNFEKKCRILLDLFKMQIVFAGMTYD